MQTGGLFLTIPVFAFTWWLGLYLVSRDASKATLRYTALGLIAYALALSADLLTQQARNPSLVGSLTRLHWAFVFLPAILWTGVLPQVLPENSTLRVILARLWSYVYLPINLLGILLASSMGWLGQSEWLPGMLLLAGLILLPMLAGSVIVIRQNRNVAPKRAFGVTATVTLFLGLSSASVLLPTSLLPHTLAVLGIGFDIILLGLSIAWLDAFAEGETLWPDIVRSFDGAVIAAALFGGQVALVMFLATGVTFPMSVLLLAIVAAAIVYQTFTDPIQAGIDQVAFSNAPELQQARADLRTAARNLPRIPADVPLDLETFTRLTRRALSHFGDLTRLAGSPLTRLPLIDVRLEENGDNPGTLARAAELKIILEESIDRLKPRNRGEFGTSDEWRYYNVLYFPYVIGIKPYSRLPMYADRLDEAEREVLEWFRSQVPERTLYNWQNAAAELVAQDILEQVHNLTEQP